MTEYLNVNSAPNTTTYPNGTYDWMRVLAGAKGSRFNGIQMDGDLDMNGFSILNTTIPFSATLGDLDNVASAVDSETNDGYVLTWNDTTKEWESRVAPSGGATDLNSLTDVSLSGVVANQALIFNGVNWVNQNLPSGGSLSLGQLTNVNPAVDAPSGVLPVMIWTGAEWNSDPLSNLISAQVPLDLLQNCNVPFPNDGDALVFNSGANQWEAVASKKTLGDLDNVASAVDTETNDGYVLTWNNTTTEWESRVLPPTAPIDLNSLTDVTLSSVVATQALIFNGVNWVNQNLPSASLSLGQLTNVALAVDTANNGDTLVYNSGANQWEAVAQPSIPSNLNDLSDVTLTAASNTELLQFNGSQWVNVPFPSIPSNLADLGDVSQVPSTNAGTRVRVPRNEVGASDHQIGQLGVGDLTEASNLTDGFLVNDGANWNTQQVNTTNLSDVVNTAPSVDGQILRWNQTQLYYEPVTIPNLDSIPQQLNDLNDVLLTTPSATEVLTYDGSQWVNAPIPAPSLAFNDLNNCDQTPLVNPFTKPRFPRNDGATSNFVTGLLSLEDMVESINGTDLFFKNNGSGWVAQPVGTFNLLDVSSTVPTNGQFLRFNTTSNDYEPVSITNIDSIPANLEDLANVVLTGPVLSQVLSFNGSQWVNSTLPAPNLGLNDLNDTSLTSPLDNQILRYVSGTWINTGINVVANLGLDLLDLRDVNGTATANSVIRRNGANTEWVPAQLNLDALIDVTVTSPVSGQILQYNSTSTQWENVANPVPSLVRDLSDVTQLPIIAPVGAPRVLKNPATSSAFTVETLNVGELGDVVSTAPVLGQSLVYNGAQYVNKSIGLGNSVTSTDLGQFDTSSTVAYQNGSRIVYDQTANIHRQLPPTKAFWMSNGRTTGFAYSVIPATANGVWTNLDQFSGTVTEGVSGLFNTISQGTVSLRQTTDTSIDFKFKWSLEFGSDVADRRFEVRLTRSTNGGSTFTDFAGSEAVFSTFVHSNTVNGIDAPVSAEGVFTLSGITGATNNTQFRLEIRLNDATLPAPTNFYVGRMYYEVKSVNPIYNVV